ncbi:tetratricopeptide repeat-containing [Desulfonema limicola]|uniref:Tetratricopeptide repeat-containing n=1 Tax=Desulfonema limicola TaxID=45656 RepID=A0A975B7E8_9BACT|nr:CRISPR-associated primase-polymerase type A1 [Desulfonema limicola]QTA80269.1 tetratricopeptide repeat-containing [Desulfonema limicola]
MIFENIYNLENLESAWAKVRANNAVPGIDRVSAADFEKNLSANLHTLQKQIREESYRPLPVVIFHNQKGNRKDRPIGISTVRDKVVQQAVLKVISPIFEMNFLPCSFAYRPKKSALSAVTHAGKLIKSGKLWALQMDVSKFFDSMNHNILIDLIARVSNEKPFVRLISRLLKAKIFREMGLFDNLAGSQQGSGLSPLLSNIYLHPMDLYLWKKYKQSYLRYSDDITIFTQDQEIAVEAQQIVEKCLKDLKLSANSQKTSISHVSNGIVYLGFFMDAMGKGPDRKSVAQLEKKLTVYNRIRNTDNIDEKLAEIIQVIRGWYNYYKTLKPVKPPNILSLMAIVSLFQDFGEPGSARELLKQGKNFEYNNARVSFLMGEYFHSLGMNTQAMREHAQAVELDPSMEPAKERIREMQEGETDIYKAIEKIQLVLHHNPGYREGYQKLARFYTELKLFGFAEKAHHKAMEIDDDALDNDILKSKPGNPDESDDFNYKDVDQDFFMSIFKGFPHAHARQWVDERGRWGFVRVDRALKKKDVYKHLQGELTLGIYPVTQKDELNFIVFDVDTAKRKILEASDLPLETFRQTSHEDILRIKTVCQAMNLNLYIEDSGYKGRHGWLFFSKPYPASKALSLGQDIMKKAGGPSENMIWELFPMGKSDRHKSIIKLPLGINRKNNRRCLFLNEKNEIIQDQGVLLKTIKTNPVEQIQDGFAKHGKDNQETNAGRDIDIPAGLKKMITECHVISHLSEKAKTTNYLNHYERIILLYTLSFAGKPGNSYLHKIIGYCVNYNQQYTQTRIDRRKASPISCAKISEYFPELTESVKCNCKFDKRPVRSYPSPVLYLLESELEQAELNMFEPLKGLHKDQVDDQLKDKDFKKETDKMPAPEQTNFETQILDFESIFSSEQINTDDPETDLSESNDFTSVSQEYDEDVYNNVSESKTSELTEKTGEHIWNIAFKYLDLKQKQKSINIEVKKLEQELKNYLKEHDIVEDRFGRIEIINGEIVLRFK